MKYCLLDLPKIKAKIEAHYQILAKPQDFNASLMYSLFNPSSTPLHKYLYCLYMSVLTLRES